jgi:hypothetical protein
MDNIKLGMRIYCGAQRPPPRNKRPGTSVECFKSGVKAGFVAGLKVQKEKSEQKTKAVEALTTMLTERMTKEQLASAIQQRGLNVLKQQLHLSKLNKDLIRSIVVSGGETIPGYSKMTKDQLINALIQRGWKR